MDSVKLKILDEYILFRRLKNHGRSIADIRNHISWFINFSKVSLDKFDEKILLNYVDSIKDKYSVVSLNTIKSSYLKNFIKWYWIDWSVRFRHLDSICRMQKAVSRFQPDDMLNEEEFKKLVRGEVSPFWKAYLMTLFYGGCRPSEVCNLKWDKVEFTDDGAFISIYSDKNKREFIKFVLSDVSFYLRSLKTGVSEYVFYGSKYSMPISVKGAYRHIVRLSQAVLGHRIDLYTLRHSISTILYNKEGQKDDDIANQMGHTKSMKSTYVHNDKAKLKAIAKNIYVSPNDIPPEKKDKFDEMTKRVEILEDLVQKFINLHKK